MWSASPVTCGSSSHLPGTHQHINTYTRSGIWPFWKSHIRYCMSCSVLWQAGCIKIPSMISRCSGLNTSWWMTQNRLNNVIMRSLFFPWPSVRHCCIFIFILMVMCGWRLVVTFVFELVKNTSRDLFCRLKFISSHFNQVIKLYHLQVHFSSCPQWK